MSVNITINADESLTVLWEGKRGSSSLFHIAAEGNIAKVNHLDADEIWAVFLCARQYPYPGGQRNQVYATILGAIRERGDKVFPDGRPQTTLGQLRKALVVHIGEQFGDTTSAYLDFVADSKKPQSA